MFSTPLHFANGGEDIPQIVTTLSLSTAEFAGRRSYHCAQAEIDPRFPPYGNECEIRCELDLNARCFCPTGGVRQPVDWQAD